MECCSSKSMKLLARLQLECRLSDQLKAAKFDGKRCDNYVFSILPNLSNVKPSIKNFLDIIAKLKKNKIRVFVMNLVLILVLSLNFKETLRFIVNF